MTTRPPSPPMTIAIQRFDRSMALTDRMVTIPNVTVAAVPPGKPGVEGLFHGTMDAAEVPLARLVHWVDQGEPIKAIPVFPDRLMVHQYIYTRPDTRIASLADLRGRRVLMPGYFITLSFWHRTLLSEAGVDAREVEWITANPEAEPRMKHPDGVRVTLDPKGNRLGIDHLLDGRVDAVMTEGTLPVPPGREREVVRVIADAHAVQRDWYRKTGFHPIVHIVGVRQEALQARPDFGLDLCRAYDAAKAHAYRQLQNERMTSLPFMRGIVDDMMELCGHDPWPYGVDRNRAELDTLLGYAHDQGFTRRHLAVDDLFDERAASYEFTSRMVTGGAVGG